MAKLKQFLIVPVGMSQEELAVSWREWEGVLASAEEQETELAARRFRERKVKRQSGKKQGKEERQHKERGNKI